MSRPDFFDISESCNPESENAEEYDNGSTVLLYVAGPLFIDQVLRATEIEE